MLHSNSTEFKEIGVDYITATAAGPRRERTLEEFGSWIVEEEVSKGEVCKPWRFSAYRGLSVPSAAYGRREDGGILRLSKHCAAEHWQQATSLATNVSRLDVQCTVVGPLGPTEQLRRHLKEAKGATRGKGKELQLKYFGGRHGIESLALGSRSSDRYLRVYDKFAESELEAYRNCLRYEVEFKNGLAWDRANLLDSSALYQRYIIAWVFELAHVRALRLDRATWLSSMTDSSLTGISRRPLADSGRLQNKLSWARFGVRPMVQEFIKAGRLHEIIDALGLTDHVDLR